MGQKPRMMHKPVEVPGKPMSTGLLAVSMKRYQRSCAALRASRLLIHLSRIGMARGRAWLEQQASQNGGSVSPEKHSPQACVAMPEERSPLLAYVTARSTEKRAAPIDRSARAMNEVCRVLTENASPRPQSLPSAVVHLRCTVGQALNRQAHITSVRDFRGAAQ